MSQHTATRGFGYLEPIRHIPFLADLDGPEAATFGPAIARASASIREASGAPLVYAYVFGGGIHHLHVHLVANLPEGALNTNILAGELEERKLPSGATEVTSRDHPDLPEAEIDALNERVRELMAR
jgi:diadenosine tetraphosphate (Ap4A) HIT family hydrolase